MILLGTNILIEIYRGTMGIIESVKQIGMDNISVSDVTRAELLYGARNKKELQLITEDLDKLVVLPINETISTLSVELVSNFSLSHKLALPDALIGATAICHELTLYTLNIKDFIFIKGVNLYSI